MATMRWATVGLILAGTIGCSEIPATASNAATQERDPGAFTGVEAQTGIDVTIQCGSASHVQLTGKPDRILEDVETNIVDGKLKIRLTGPHFGVAEVKAVVTTPKPLTSFAASSSGRVRVDTCAVSTDMVSVTASSSGNIVIGGKTRVLNAAASSSGRITANDGGLVADDCNLTASSSGNIEIGGIAHVVHAVASSSGRIKDEGRGRLVADQADLIASSSGEISLCKIKSAHAMASSSGTISLDQDTDVQSTTSSSGHIHRDRCS